jgi:uncharacterized membrane protein
MRGAAAIFIIIMIMIIIIIIIVIIFYGFDVEPVEQNSANFDIGLAKLTEATFDEFDSGLAGSNDEYGSASEMADNCGVRHIQSRRRIN